MSSTTTFGIDIDTGDSVSNLDQTTRSMNTLLEKYIALMDQAGKADQAFGNIAKAIGLHTQMITEATKEANKVLISITQENLNKTQDMTVRGLSRNITTQFNKLTESLKESLSGIPKEIKGIMAGLGELAQGIEFRLSGVDAKLHSIADALKEVDKIIDSSVAKAGKAGALNPPGVDNTKLQKQLQAYGVYVNTLATLQKNLKNSAGSYSPAILNDDSLGTLENKYQEALDIKKQLMFYDDKASTKAIQHHIDTLEKLIDVKKTVGAIDSIDDTFKRKRAYNEAVGMVDGVSYGNPDKIKQELKETASYVDVLQARLSQFKNAKNVNIEEWRNYNNTLNTTRIKLKELSEANVDIDKEASRALLHLQTEVYTLGQEYTKLKRNSGINLANDFKVALPTVAELRNQIHGLSVAYNHEEFKNLPIDQLKTFRKELAYLKGQASLVGSREDALVLSGMINPLKEIIRLKEEAHKKSNTAVSWIESMGMAAPKIEEVRAELLKLSAVLTSSELKGVTLAELKNNLERLQSLKQDTSVLGFSGASKAIGYSIRQYEEEIAAREAKEQKIDSLLQNRMENQKKLETEYENYLHNIASEEEKQQRLLEIEKQRKIAWEMLSKAVGGIDSQGQSKKALDYLEEQESLKKALRTPDSKTSSMFTSIETTVAYIEDIKELIVDINKAIDVTDDKVAKINLTEQVAGLENYITLIKKAAQGINTQRPGTSLDGISTTQTKEELEILKAIATTQEKIRESYERISNSKGSPKDIRTARKEISEYKEELYNLDKRRQDFTKNMSAVSSSSAGAERIKNALRDANKETSNLLRKTNELNSNYKTLWTEASQRMMKFLLTYHTVGVSFSIVGGIFNSIKETITGIGEAGSKIINMEKSLQAIRGESPAGVKAVREDKERIKQIADYYGYTQETISKFYVKLAGMQQMMGLSKEGVASLFEEVVAGAKGLGLTANKFEELSMGIEQVLGKGKAKMEDLTTQIAEKVPAALTVVQNYLAGLTDVDAKTGKTVKRYADLLDANGNLDLASNINKFTKFSTSYEDYIAGIRKGMITFAAVADKVRHDFVSNVQRMEQAWQDVKASLMVGQAGESIINAIQTITKTLQDPTVVSGLSTIVATLTKVVEMFVKLSAYILPEVVKIAADLGKKMGVDVYKETANSGDSKLKKAFMRSVYDYGTELSMPKSVPVLNNIDSFAFKRGMVGQQYNGQGTFGNFYSDYKNEWNEQIALLELNNVPELMAKGYLALGEKANSQIKDANDALKRSFKLDPDKLGEQVTTPIIQYLKEAHISIDDFIKNEVIPAAVKMAQYGGEYSKLLSEQMDAENAKRAEAAAAQQQSMEEGTQGYGTNLGAVGVHPHYFVKGSRYLATNPIKPLGLPAGSTEDNKAEKENMEKLLQTYQEKMQQYKDMEEAAQEDGNYAKKMMQSYQKSELEALKATGDFKELSQAQQDALTNQIKAAGAAQAGQVYRQAMQELESIDAEIEARIAGGNLKNELKTQYEDLIKWQINTEKKLEKSMSGLQEVDLQKRYAKIQQAVERGSEQALTQGNTPMEIIAKAEKKAAEGRVDAWESTYKELVDQTAKYSQIQIQNQWDLMTTLDDISGKRTEKEKKRVEEAAVEVSKQFKNIALLQPIKDLKLTELDQADFDTKKNLLGDIYDATKIEETTLATQRLTDQMKVLKEAGWATSASYKELARQQQALTDQVKEAEIENSGSFEEYLNKRFAHENGLNDNDVSATKKRYEDMYQIIESGATELGGTIKDTFIDAFSGTLDSWNDVWKSMKQTFLRTLGEMIWESKMKPITVGVIAGVTGMGTGSAFANDAQGGAIANQVAGLFGGGSGSGSTYRGGMGSQGGNGGLFSTFAKLPEAIDSFGKDVLQLGDKISLASSMGAGLLGFGLGSAIGGSAQAGIGGAMGSALGNMAGQGLAEAFGSMAPGIGQVIGLAAGTVIGSMFAGDKVTSKGMELRIGDGGILYAKNYTNYKSSGMFGGGKRTEYEAADRNVVYQLNREISKQTSTLEDAFRNLGVTTSTEGFSTKGEKIDLRENADEAIKAWLTKISGKMADYMVGNSNEIMKFETLKNFSESSADAVIRLSTALDSFTTAAVEANISINNLTGGLKGLDLAYYTSKLTDALGGEDQLHDFFDIITDFSTYLSGAGTDNIKGLTDQLNTSFNRIKEVYQTEGNNAQISIKKDQINTTIANRDSLYYDYIDKYDNAGTAWGKFINMNPQTELIETTGTIVDAMTGTVITFNEWLNGNSKALDFWNNSLKGWVENYNEATLAIPKAQEELAAMEAEEAKKPTAQIDPTSTTFWTDFDKVLKNLKGLTPELAAAWYESAQLAKQIVETNEATYEAAEAARELKAEYWESNMVTVKAAMYMGLASEGMINIAKEAQALNQHDLPAWFADNADRVEDLVPGLTALSYEGETALDTFKRLGQTLMDITDAAGVAGVSLSELSGGLTGIDLAQFSQELVDVFGSSDAVTSAFQRYNKLTNSEDEQKALGKDYWAKQATSRFGVLQDKFPGITTDNFAEKYKEAMSAGLDPYELKQWDYAAEAIENMADAAGEAANAVDELAEYLKSIQDKIDEFGMSDIDKFLKDTNADREDMKEQIIEKGGTTEQDVLDGKVAIADTAIADEWYAAAIADKFSEIMEEITKGLDDINLGSFDKQMAEIAKSTAESIEAVTKLGGTEEDLAKVREYETAQINKLKEAHQEYVQDIQDKITAFGQSDTDKFLSDLDKEVKEMKEKLVDTGGAMADTVIADVYRVEAIHNRLKETMEGINESIASLNTNDFVYKIKEVKKSLEESIVIIKQLGGTEADLAKARTLAILQAQEIIKEAAQAYITAYDDKLQEIEDLKNEKQALLDAVDTARNDYLDALQKEIDLKQESIDKLQESVDNLEAFVKSMDELKNSLLTDAGFLSASEKAGVAMSNFLETARKAAEGDEDARSGLSGAASSAIEAAKGGSYESYIRAFATVYGKLNAVQGGAKKELEQKKPELEALIASRDALQAIYDKLKEEADKTKTIDEALIAYENAKRELLNSTLDAQIAAAQAEADRHKETVEFLRKQYEETVSLSTAAKTYFDTVNEARSSGLVDETVLISSIDKSALLTTTATATDATQQALQAANDLAFKSKKVLEKTYDKADEILYFMQEDNKKLYKLLGDTYYGTYSYTETVEGVPTNKTDVGLKVIVSSAQLKGGILSALREANDLTSVDATSVIGLLNGIKNCACTCQCESSCAYYDEADAVCSIMEKDVTVIADSSGLADQTFGRTFSTIDGAITRLAYLSLSVSGMDTLTSSEDPDCAEAFYIMVSDVA